MAITGSGLYGLTLEKWLNQTIQAITSGLESETAVSVLMVTDTYTPDFNTHDFYNDITNEVTGTGYTAGGMTATGTEITIAGGNLTYDMTDVAWTTSTIADAMAAVARYNVGASNANELLFLSDFVNAASSSGGTFTIQWSPSGVFVVDYVP